MEADPAETRYRGAVDVKRAANLYAQGRSLRQIGPELGVPWTRRGPSTSMPVLTGDAGVAPPSIREIVDGRNDILAEAVGVAAGSWYASPAGHVEHEPVAVGMLILAVAAVCH